MPGMDRTSKSRASTHPVDVDRIPIGTLLGEPVDLVIERGTDVTLVARPGLSDTGRAAMNGAGWHHEFSVDAADVWLSDRADLARIALERSRSNHPSVSRGVDR